MHILHPFAFLASLRLLDPAQTLTQYFLAQPYQNPEMSSKLWELNETLILHLAQPQRKALNLLYSFNLLNSLRFGSSICIGSLLNFDLSVWRALKPAAKLFSVFISWPVVPWNPWNFCPLESLEPLLPFEPLERLLPFSLTQSFPWLGLHEPGSGSMSLSLLSTSDHLVRRLLFASRSCWGLPGREKIKPNFSLIWDYSTYIWPTDSLNRNFWAKILKQCSWGQHLPTHSTAKEKRSSMHWYRNLGVKCWMEGFSATNSSANAPT